MAYYALLSIVPMLILTVVVLLHVVEQQALLDTLALYLEWLVPGQSATVLLGLREFLDHRDVVGWVLLATMLFFSSLAFSVLENALSIIFHHRVKTRRRPFIVSALMPYGFILCLGLGLLVVTMVAGQLQQLGQHSMQLGGHRWSLEPTGAGAAVRPGRGGVNCCC